MKLRAIGIDLAKDVFDIHGVDEHGKVLMQKRVSRRPLLGTLSKVEPCLVGMEACASAHYWSREIERLGHSVRLMSPQFVRPYRKGNKNDPNDAAAICEALTRPSMRFVPAKSQAQQDIQALHRVREQLLKGRTALVNQARGLLGEYGIVTPGGIAKLRRLLVELVADPAARGLRWTHGRDSGRDRRAPALHRPAQSRHTISVSSESLPTTSAVSAWPRSQASDRWWRQR